MITYLKMLETILNSNSNLRLNRTGIPDIGLAEGLVFSHNMEDGFPLLTTKFVPMKSVATELEFFIRGITDKKWLQDRHCTIWNEWARPSKVEQSYNFEYDNLCAIDGWNPKDKIVIKDKLGNDIQMTRAELLKNTITDKERDLGPIYGFNWRHFGGKYLWNEDAINKNPENNFDPKNPGVDQVKNVIDKLHNNQNDRRMYVTAWNPVEMPDMALPPCHISHQLVVRDGKLSLTWYQRSCDMFLGVPFNIASYALLLLLYAKEANLKPYMLKGILTDAHIYQNHIPQVKEQLSRVPLKLPKLEISNENWNGMLNWHADGGFKLNDYVHLGKLKASVAR